MSNLLIIETVCKRYTVLIIAFYANMNRYFLDLLCATFEVDDHV